MTTARLAGPADVEGFRRIARLLLAQGVQPAEVAWHSGDDTPLLWDGIDDFQPDGLAPPPAISVPADFVRLCQSALLHRESQRFALMYRLLWRFRHEPGLRHDPLDADRRRAEQLAREVRKDIHKMRAFVRFTPAGVGAGGGERHIAWFEPEHHIVEANAPFFMRRFAQMHWAILTPERSVEWDGRSLQFGPGGDRRDAPPPDAGAQLWLTYYQHIFNPARLKLAMMTKEMPRRYWANLPEAVLIAPLAATATARSDAMIEAPASPPRPVRLLSREAIMVSNLTALETALHACESCPLHASATRVVPGVGSMGARHMVVGEQPGDEEDRSGQPFVGPAGRLLNEALDELGWSRESLYVTNAVKHFKFEWRGKRRMHKTAAQREVEACGQWLVHEMRLVNPRWLVALGATAARALLGRAVSIGEEHGRWLYERADGRPVLVTWHPAALLRMPAEQFEEAYAGWRKDLALAQAGFTVPSARPSHPAAWPSRSTAGASRDASPATGGAVPRRR